MATFIVVTLLAVLGKGGTVMESEMRHWGIPSLTSCGPRLGDWEARVSYHPVAASRDFA